VNTESAAPPVEDAAQAMQTQTQVGAGTTRDMPRNAISFPNMGGTAVSCCTLSATRHGLDVGRPWGSETGHFRQIGTIILSDDCLSNVERRKQIEKKYIFENIENFEI
jgi:hypothetical protein